MKNKAILCLGTIIRMSRAVRYSVDVLVMTAVVGRKYLTSYPEGGVLFYLQPLVSVKNTGALKYTILGNRTWLSIRDATTASTGDSPYIGDQFAGTFTADLSEIPYKRWTMIYMLCENPFVEETIANRHGVCGEIN